VQDAEVAHLSIAAARAASTTEKSIVAQIQVRQLVRAAPPDHPKGANAIVDQDGHDIHPTTVRTATCHRHAADLKSQSKSAQILRSPRKSKTEVAFQKTIKQTQAGKTTVKRIRSSKNTDLNDSK